MTELTSISFPEGIRSNRTEAQARADLNMAQVINLGAARQKQQPHGCPWCAADPFPAVKVCNRWVIACENEDCKIDVQAAGDTAEEALKLWNARS